MKRKNKAYDLEFKRRIVAEFIKGDVSAAEIAHREHITSSHIYKWKSQLERKSKETRIGELVDDGASVEAARRILELEEELADARQLIAGYALANEFLKKIQEVPEKKSSGYIETKRRWGRSKGRVK